MPTFETTISDRKLAANRANAAKSTGPKSDDGKARSASNSLRHGLTAKCPISIGERPEDYTNLHESFIAEFNPATPLAHALVEQLTDLQWRLRRIDDLEAGLFNDTFPSTGNRNCVARMALNSIRARALRRPDVLQEFDCLSRHFARIKRAFDKTLSQLLELRKSNNLQEPVGSFVKPRIATPPAAPKPSPIALPQRPDWPESNPDDAASNPQEPQAA